MYTLQISVRIFEKKFENSFEKCWENCEINTSINSWVTFFYIYNFKRLQLNEYCIIYFSFDLNLKVIPCTKNKLSFIF